MTWITERILIWGKTYPELSATYTETVCTAGVLESGQPVRLYPFPLRYMEKDSRFAVYDWITVPVSKSTRDTRQESFKVEYEKLQRLDHIGAGPAGWAERQRWVFKDPSWRYANMGDLLNAAKTANQSLGIIRPGIIEDVMLEKKTAGEEADFHRKLESVGQQHDLFADPEAARKELRFRAYRILLRWRCDGFCAQCRRAPHRMQVLDWGLFELAQKRGWEKAVQKLGEISNPGAHDFHLFLGNTKAHPHNFLVVGLWYPKIQTQGLLLLE